MFKINLRRFDVLTRRNKTIDFFSGQVYDKLPLSKELARIKELFPENKIMKEASKFYDLSIGAPSEDPVLLTKILFLSFYYDVKGDKKTLETLKYRIDWKQFCDLELDAELPDRTTLVKFRQKMGLNVIEIIFHDLLKQLAGKQLITLSHRFFDGTPSKARARIDSFRDEIYEEVLSAIDEKLKEFRDAQVKIDASLNTTPVQLEKEEYPVDNKLVELRRSQQMKSASERTSAGDTDAHFQRGKHGKKSELGYEIFFSTDGKELFIVDVDVSSEAGKGQTIFKEKLEQSQQGQQWSVDKEFSTGEILKKAEEKKVILNTPLCAPKSKKGKFSKAEFTYNEEDDTYTCPNGKTLNLNHTNKKTGDRQYRPEKGTCNKCPLKDQCTSSQKGRTINRSAYEEAMERNREHSKTPQAVIGKILRGIIAEGKFAEALRHGLKAMRYVGEKMAIMQSKLIALILNFKRLLRIEEAKGRIL